MSVYVQNMTVFVANMISFVPYITIFITNGSICVQNISVIVCWEALAIIGDKGYTVKYNPLPEGVPKGEARGNSWRQRGIFDRISRVESYNGQYIILTVIKLIIPSKSHWQLVRILPRECTVKYTHRSEEILKRLISVFCIPLLRMI